MEQHLDVGASQVSKERLAGMYWLVELMARKKQAPLNMLEIGSYEGESAVFWSHAIANAVGELVGEFIPSHRGSVLCIDPWIPYLTKDEVSMNKQHCGKMQEDLASGAVFARFRKNILLAPRSVPIRYERATFYDAFPDLFRHVRNVLPFDLIYVDGCHRFSSVVVDLSLAKLLIAPGGIICGDDLELPRKDVPDYLVQDCLKHAESDFLGHFHPGVTLGVDFVFKDSIWTGGGAWAVMEKDNNWGVPQ